MHAKRIILTGCVVVTMSVMLAAKSNVESTSGVRMSGAAQDFLDTLSDAQRQQATFRYNDPERLNWHFIPRERKGLPLKQLEGDALKTAHRLLASGLSKAGYDQTLEVMSLEEVLYLLEEGEREKRRARRDPQKYYLSVFGKPAATGTWGWRLEGHHVSLNYSIADGNVVASTPEFFGANPSMIDAGPGRSIRVLAAEEDIARQILKLCSAEQQRKLWIEKKAPRDLRGGGVAQPETTAAVGLPASKMNSTQKALLAELLSEYLKNMPADIERERRQQINDAGLDNISFAWWGEAERNQPHYYRVQGPTFLVEFNNTQNSANHAHSIWRNLAGDFNVALNRE